MRDKPGVTGFREGGQAPTSARGRGQTCAQQMREDSQLVSGERQALLGSGPMTLASPCQIARFRYTLKSILQEGCMNTVYAKIAIVIAVTLSALVLAAPAIVNAAEPSPTDLRVHIEVRPPAASASEAVTLLYTLHNDSPENVQVLYRQTPLRGILGDIFEVRLNGQSVDYTGLIVEWAAPEDSDFIEIPAGSEASAIIDLSAAYDMSRVGEYSVRYRVPPSDNLWVKNANSAARFARLNSDAITVWIGRDEAAQPRPTHSPFDDSRELAPFGSTTVSPGFVDCSISRTMTLKATLTYAQAFANQARSQLTASTPRAGYADKDYRTWFGCYDPVRYAKVKRNFGAIAKALSSHSFTLHCSDLDTICRTSGGFAYAERKNPYHVHLCERFWSLPFLSINSKIGALIHETSHFTAVADTVDVIPTTVYNCQLIADRRPDLAITYACNYQYFAESPPSTESGSVAPTIGRVSMPSLSGDGTPGFEELGFANDDCDPIVLIENHLVSAPSGIGPVINWKNPTLAEGTWKNGLFLLRYTCHFTGHGKIGPIVVEHVLVDAGGRRSNPKTSPGTYCYNP